MVQMTSAGDLLRDIGIAAEPETLLFKDDYPIDPVAYHKAHRGDYTSRDRLEARGLDVDRTPVDAFFDRPDLGFLSLEDED